MSQPDVEKTSVRSSLPSDRLSDDEKGRVTQIEQTGGDGKQGSTLYNPDVDVSGVDERKLMRKLDWHLVPWLSFLYLLSFLDRTSIGNAKVSLPFSLCLAWIFTCFKLYGMEEDLHISDQQYLIALTIFFFPYALLEVRRLISVFTVA